MLPCVVPLDTLGRKTLEYPSVGSFGLEFAECEPEHEEAPIRHPTSQTKSCKIRAVLRNLMTQVCCGKSTTAEVCEVIEESAKEDCESRRYQP